MNRLARAVFQRNRKLWGIYRSAFDLAFQWKARLLARSLSNDPDEDMRKISEALMMLATGGDTPGREWIERIEGLRVKMLNNGSPLVDGSLDEAGIYDGGNKTIASACLVSKPPRAAFFLYCLVRAFNSRRILELGTNVGISSAYLAAAGSGNATGKGLVTLESSRYRQRVAIRLHKELHLTNISYVHGLFSEVLAVALNGQVSPDFVFIDGHHQYQPTLDYLDQVAVHASAACVFVFDDIDWSDGVRRAWKVIQQDRRFSTVVDFRTVGVCVLGTLGKPRRIVTGRHRIF